MKLELYTYKENEWNRPLDTSLDSEKTLVLVFGSAKKKLIGKALKFIYNSFTHATVCGASSAGEIIQDQLMDKSVVVAVMKFHTTKIFGVSKAISSASSSYNDGANLAKAFPRDGLRGVLVLSDGLNVNGSKLTQGISSVFSNNVIVTGGLAADGDRFESTWVLVDREPRSNFITAVGFYGKDIHISHGSKGGWDRLGLERIVTKSEDNVLYELDDQPALELYKSYLGDQAKNLPASGLLFPLELKASTDDIETKVRTILAVDEEKQSITFAGDIPEGSHVTLMKANYDRLIDGAYTAAESVELGMYNDEPILNIAISCVGRRLVLKQRTEEELEATLDVLPKDIKQIGFYSYGEISPMASGKCDLHNQTMTLTTIWEKNAPSS
jgi:hypothetical protein